MADHMEQDKRRKKSKKRSDLAGEDPVIMEDDQRSVEEDCSAVDLYQEEAEQDCQTKGTDLGKLPWRRSLRSLEVKKRRRLWISREGSAQFPALLDHTHIQQVYFLLTSGLTVTIDGHDVHYEPGQAFTVPCGHAYSLHNLTQEPAVLHFTRMLAESSE
ncbi:hypothetical protein DPEC_G00379800 [Dallia pectoralis]|nr:hypothetical protein DPEC_G00379800 [Dallia pectoralis]